MGALSPRRRTGKKLALSSTEAEYYGLSNATREALWLRSLLRSLGYDEGLDLVVIEGDNQGSLALTENPEFHQRTKHIDIKHHFLRQEVGEKRVAFSYVKTTKLAADGLTSSSDWKAGLLQHQPKNEGACGVLNLYSTGQRVRGRVEFSLCARREAREPCRPISITTARRITLS
jgi:hypothetical protein